MPGITKKKAAKEVVEEVEVASGWGLFDDAKKLKERNKAFWGARAVVERLRGGRKSALKKGGGRQKSAARHGVAAAPRRRDPRCRRIDMGRQTEFFERPRHCDTAVARVRLGGGVQRMDGAAQVPPGKQNLGLYAADSRVRNRAFGSAARRIGL